MSNQIGKATVDKMRIILGGLSIGNTWSIYQSSHSGGKTYELYKEGIAAGKV